MKQTVDAIRAASTIADTIDVIRHRVLLPNPKPVVQMEVVFFVKLACTRPTCRQKPWMAFMITDHHGHTTFRFWSEIHCPTCHHLPRIVARVVRVLTKEELAGEMKGWFKDPEVDRVTASGPGNDPVVLKRGSMARVPVRSYSW